MRNRRAKEQVGVRANIPAWLSNPDLAAPCPCGFPLLPNHTHVMVEGEAGMKRWLHAHCYDMMFDEDDDDED